MPISMPHRPRRLLAVVTGTVLAAVGGVVSLTAQPAWAAATGGSGASLPYAEVGAAGAATTGRLIGPSYTQGQLADEASGRRAVSEGATG